MIAGLRRGRYAGIGDGSTRRSMVLATDVAAALPELAALAGVFHLTDRQHPSFSELEAAICEALGANFAVPATHLRGPDVRPGR